MKKGHIETVQQHSVLTVVQEQALALTSLIVVRKVVVMFITLKNCTIIQLRCQYFVRRGHRSKAVSILILVFIAKSHVTI